MIGALSLTYLIISFLPEKLTHTKVTQFSFEFVVNQDVLRFYVSVYDVVDVHYSFKQMGIAYCNANL